MHRCAASSDVADGLLAGAIGAIDKSPEVRIVPHGLYDRRLLALIQFLHASGVDASNVQARGTFL